MAVFGSENWLDKTARAADAPALALLHLRDWLGGRRFAGRRRDAQLVLTTTDSHDNFRQMAFTFAVIALAAKLCAADGKPTRDEFMAFREAFPMPAGEHEKIRRLFGMALRDGADATDHARRVAALFPPARHRALLRELLARLMRVAGSDGAINPCEDGVLQEVARIFHIGRRVYARILRDHRELAARPDPYAVLGVGEHWKDADIRSAYMKLMREHHPDSVQSRGGSADAVLVASRQVAQLNAAYNAIRAERRTG